MINIFNTCNFKSPRLSVQALIKKQSIRSTTFEELFIISLINVQISHYPVYKGFKLNTFIHIYIGDTLNS